MPREPNGECASKNGLRSFAALRRIKLHSMCFDEGTYVLSRVFTYVYLHACTRQYPSHSFPQHARTICRGSISSNETTSGSARVFAEDRSSAELLLSSRTTNYTFVFAKNFELNYKLAAYEDDVSPLSPPPPPLSLYATSS